MPLHEGPSRIRAGDAERHEAMQLIERAYGEGRLTDEEFEERSGRVLGARTFGELRGLVDDLPGATERRRLPEPDVPALMPRPRRRVGRWVAAIVCGLIGVNAVVGAVFAPRLIEDASPPAGGPPARAEYAFDLDAPARRTIALGRRGVDDQIGFRVLRVRTVRRLPLAGGAGAVPAGRDRVWVVAAVEVDDEAGGPADPFCDADGARLRVRGSGAVEPYAGLDRLDANQGSVCRFEPLPPERVLRATLAFRVAAGDEPAALELHNPRVATDEGGRRSRLVVPLD